METALQPPPRAGSVASDRPCASTIDRKAVVSRHNVVYYKAHPDQLLQVGNGEIAFGVDVTGLQTSAGNTFSQWGWHSAPLPAGTRIADFKMAPYEVNGRSVGYPTDSRGQEALYQWLRENPHRMNLGRFSLKLSGEDGTEAGVHALQNVRQELDLWTGTITSSYELDGIPVVVETLCHPPSASSRRWFQAEGSQLNSLFLTETRGSTAPGGIGRRRM
jgi:hypothetical protein